MKLTETELELALALKSDELINMQAELDNERQYQVSMEYLWAEDRELISTLTARIEDLELELYDMNALYGQVKDGLEAKLAKAVEALRKLDRRNDSLDTFNSAVHEIVSTTLAELEGEPLGAEFEAVWDANKGKLYEP